MGMKTLQKHIKVIRNTLLSLICASFFVVSSILPAKADVIKQGTTATSYGSYHWECFAGTTDSPISLGLNIIGINLTFRSGSGFSFRYNFKDKYSGQITIGITTGSSWRFIDSYCTVNGGAFNSTPANSSQYLTYHSFTINFEQCDCFEFTVYLDGAAYSNYFDANTTISISYGRTPVVDDMLTQIDSTLDTYLPGMSTSLGTIVNTLSNIYQSIGQTLAPEEQITNRLTAFYTFLDEIDDAVSNIYIPDYDQYLTDILSNLMDGNVSYLAEIYTAISNISINDYSTALTNILAAINGIPNYSTLLTNIYNSLDAIDIPDYETQINNINTKINSISSYLSSISTSITNIRTSLTTYMHSNLNIPFWQIPAYQWVNFYRDTSGAYTNWQFNNYTGYHYIRVNTSNNNQQYTSSRAIKVRPDHPMLLVFISNQYLTPFGQDYSNIKIYGETTDTNTGMVPSHCVDSGYIPVNSNYYLNWIILNEDIPDIIDDYYGFEIEFSSNFNISPLYLGEYNTAPQDVLNALGWTSALTDSYLSLLNDINDNISNIPDYSDQLQQIINGIGTISQQQIIQNNTNITNYNSYESQIDVIQDNYYTIYNTYDQTINNNHVFDFSDIVFDLDTQGYNMIFSQVWGIDLVKYPLSITLLCAIILIILG